MADEHAAAHGGGGEGGGANPFDEVVFWLLFALMVLWVLNMGWTYVMNTLGISFSLPSFTDIVAWILNTFQVYSIFLSLVFFLGIIYFNFKLGELSHHGHGDHGHDGHDTHGDSHHAPVSAGHKTDPRWIGITQKMASSNESDWRYAILDADIILDDMLTRMGYHGEGVGEKLKQANESDFHTLQSAWQAHIVRNNIAHGGSNYKLSRSEAERTISLFKKVFEEFYFI